MKRTFYWLKRLEWLRDPLALALVFWVARFWYSAHFGLYEDDFTYVAKGIAMNLDDLGKHIAYMMENYWANRPFLDLFIHVFSYLGWKIGGLWGVYWIGYLLELVNVLLFYNLLKRLYDRSLALVGGLAYALFTADTTQAHLTHSLGAQPSLTLLLLAFHCYLSNRKVLAYLLSFLIVLFAYETPFLVFIAAPLLAAQAWNKRLLGQFTFHALIVIAMVGTVYGLRVLRGLPMDTGHMFSVMLHNTLYGPVFALKSYLSRPRYVLSFSLPETNIAIAVSAPFLAWLLWGLRASNAPCLGDLVRLRLPENIRKLLRLFIAGLVMLVAAYPFTITTDATEIVGRETRAHLAGVGGAALVVASAALLVAGLFRTAWWRKLVSIGLAVVFAGLIGYGFRIQLGYVRAWELQQQFWRELLPLIPDVREGTAILVNPAGLENIWQIGANTWNLPRVLDQIYTFPVQITDVPRVYRLIAAGGENTDLVRDESGLFHIDGHSVTAPGDYYGQFPSNHIIVIETGSSQMVRRSAPIVVNGKIYPLKPVTVAILPSLPHGVLYELLITTP